MFVVDGKGQTTYSVINGQLVDTPLEARLGKETPALIAAVRQLNNRAMTRDALINHLPAIVAAVPISSEKLTNVPPIAGHASIMVFVNLFTPEKALQNNEFRPYYQPRYQLPTGQLASAEALAEGNGLIATISDWVLMCACQNALD